MMSNGMGQTNISNNLMPSQDRNDYLSGMYIQSQQQQQQPSRT